MQTVVFITPMVCNLSFYQPIFNFYSFELVYAIENKATNAEALIDLLMIAKYFERIGDHAENIAEWVIYSITGKHA